MSVRRFTPDYLKEHINVKKLNPIAELPIKDRPSDIGYDITLIARTDNRAEDNIHDVNMFSTGLMISPPPGYYIEVVAKNSLQRSGYMLATGITIVDPETADDELIVPLYKFKESQDIDLPFRAVQIVLRKAEYAHIAAVTLTNRREIGYPPQTNVYNSQGMNSQYQTPTMNYNMTSQNGGNGHFY